MQLLEAPAWLTGNLCPLLIVADAGLVHLLKFIEPGYKVLT